MRACERTYAAIYKYKLIDSSAPPIDSRGKLTSSSSSSSPCQHLLPRRGVLWAASGDGDAGGALLPLMNSRHSATARA
jgi:hypothetical protein